MLCDHCGDCYELLRGVRALNQFANLFGGTWTVWIMLGVGTCRCSDGSFGL